MHDDSPPTAARGLWRRRLPAVAVVTSLMSLTGLGSLPASAKTWVVLASDEETVAAAATLRAALTMADPESTVLDASTTTLRLRGPMGPPVAIEPIRTTLETAEEAFNALEQERSVSILESVIGRLEQEPDFSTEKLEILQEARLRAARRLVGLAGPGETGKAETRNGQRAQKHLEAALRADPTLVLDPVKTPPKLRSLLALASETVKQSGHGGVDVTSKPAGKAVILEGRKVGLTPLVTTDTVPTGRYRLWVGDGDRRSFTRVIDVGEGALPVQVNVGVEGSLWSAGPGLLPPNEPFDDEDLRQLLGIVGADVVAVIQRSSSSPQVLVIPADATPTAVGLASLSDVDVQAAAAAVVAGQGAPASPTFYQPVVTTATVVEDDFPWVAVGVGAGVGAIVITGAVTAGVLYLTRETTISVNVVEKELSE